MTVGSPGSIDPITGRLEYASHLRGWHEVDLPVRLRNALGVPVEIVNDVRLAAVAEMAARAAPATSRCCGWAPVSGSRT